MFCCADRWYTEIHRWCKTINGFKLGTKKLLRNHNFWLHQIINVSDVWWRGADRNGLSVGQLQLPLAQKSMTRILLLKTGNVVNENGYIHFVFTGTHKATDLRDYGHFFFFFNGKGKWVFIHWRLFINWQQPQFSSSLARAVGEDSFWEMKM